MSNDLPEVMGIRSGNKAEVRNVGVARLQGAQLLAEGFKINWLYYIIDLGVLATYENQNRNVWLGADGIPVAGDTAILATLPPPLEGQKYYNIQTNQPMQYKGGAWGGSSWAAFQVLAPTTVILTDSQVLVPGRDYIVNCDGKSFTFPNSTVAKNGHTARLAVKVGSVGNKVVAGAGTTITTLDVTGLAELELLQSQVYDYVYLDGAWIGFTESATLYLRAENNLSDLTDVAEARANLSVLTAEETQSLAQSIDAATNGGLLAQGIVGSSGTPRRFRVDFATEAEVTAGAAVAKSINPATLQATLAAKVDQAVGASKYNTVTGLTAGSSAFSVTVTMPSTVNWTLGAFAINPDPALLSSSVSFGTLSAGSLAVPNVAGYVLQYLQCNNVGAVSFTTNAAINPLAVRLAAILVKDGAILWAIPMPQLATADYFLRGKIPEITGSTVGYQGVGTSGQLTTTTATLMAESANWVVKTPDLNYLQQPAVNPQSWAYWRNSTTEISVGQTVVDGRLYSDGSTVPAANFTIQNVLRDIGGRLYIVVGRTQFTTMALAVAGLAGATPIVPAHLTGIYKEVGRIILKGDQHAGNAALNLADTAKAQFFDAAALGAAAASGTGAAQDVRTVTTAGTTLQYYATYIIVGDINSNLPPLASDGAWIDVKAEYPGTPTVTAAGANTIVDTSNGRVDTALTLNSYRDYTRLYVRNGAWRF